MKSGILFIIVSILYVIGVTGQDLHGKSDSVEIIQDFKNLFHFQNLYLGGQPTYETLLWLKSKGVTKIINLRSERENTEFAAAAFNEVTIAKNLGFDYHSLPVDGIKDYSPEKLAGLDSLVNGNEQILIHCASGGRVTDFTIAYLVKSQGYSVNDAVNVGRKLKFSMPVEKLLNTEISFKAAEH